MLFYATSMLFIDFHIPPERKTAIKQRLLLCPPDPEPPQTFEGHYDIRRGAAGYAPVIGTFGALSVPAIVVLLTVKPLPSPLDSSLIPLAAGLLIVSVISSLASAIALSAIGAQRDATANLIPATMFFAVSVAISLIAVLASFEVMAALYLPAGTGSTKTLFTVIVGIGGLCGAFFTALSIEDSWHMGPKDPVEREVWRKDSNQWIKSYSQANWWTDEISVISSAPTLAGIIFRIFSAGVKLTTYSANVLVAVTLAVTMIAVIMGAERVRHSASNSQKGLRPWEAFATPLSISCYTLAVMLFLP